MMKQKTKNILLNSLGVFFIFYGFFAMFNAYFFQSYPSGVFWFCYISMIIIGVGALFRNSYIIAVQTSILFIPLIIWNIDFFYYLFTNEVLFGIVEGFFLNEDTISRIVSLEHIFLIPLSIYLIHLIKLKRVDFWKVSLIEIFLIFFITRIFTSAEHNINCVHASCFPFVGNYLFPIVWFTLGFCAVTLGTLALLRMKFLFD